MFLIPNYCSSDLKNFENSQTSASNFKSFSRSLEQFFLRVGPKKFEKQKTITCSSDHTPNPESTNQQTHFCEIFMVP